MSKIIIKNENQKESRNFQKSYSEIPVLNDLRDLNIIKVKDDHTIYFKVKDKNYMLHLAIDDPSLAQLYKRDLSNSGHYNLTALKSRYSAYVNNVRQYIRIKSKGSNGYEPCFFKNIVYSHIDKEFFVKCLYRDGFVKFSYELYNKLNIEGIENEQKKILEEIAYHESKINTLREKLVKLRGF